MRTVALESAGEATKTKMARARPVADFAELVKARLTLLVLLTTAVGFYLAADSVSYGALFHVVFGTALAAAGAAALNQWWEWRLDALMQRTKMRPVPAGRMLARDAVVVGSVLSAAGVVYLAVATNLLAAIIAAATIVIYIFGYTPLKRITTTNTLVGAIPGALPPLIGWAAARNDLSLPAWCLFAILFCWQMPHFYAIAWMFREDYARAGFRMLSTLDEHGLRSGRQSVLFAFLFLCASTTPGLLGITSHTLLPLALAIGGVFVLLALRFYLRKDVPDARRLFIGSVICLPALLAALVFTKS